jgi:hypothetical protein
MPAQPISKPAVTQQVTAIPVIDLLRKGGPCKTIADVEASGIGAAVATKDQRKRQK